MRGRDRAAYFRGYRKSHVCKGGPRGKDGPRPIIAIDGEGYSLADGSHRYTYLAACDDEGLVRELRAPKGVSPEQVWTFLMALPSRALIVGYALGYDRTKWVEAWPDAAVWSLCRPDERLCESGPYPVEWNGWRINLVATRLSVQEPETHKRRTVWDVFKFYQSSFVKALERWQVGTPQERARIAREKKRRGSFAGIGPRERVYCQLECRLCAVLVGKLVEAHEKEGLKLSSYFGPGSTAAIVLRQHGDQRARVPEEMKIPVRAAYFGGRFECSRVGPVRAKELFAYDITSAYPYAMTRLPCFRHGRWSHVPEGCINWRDPGQIALVRYRVEPHKDACEAWGPLPHRMTDGNILFPRQSAGGWAWNEELAAGAALHPGVRALDSWVWCPSCDCAPPFAKRIRELFERRVAWGKTAEGIVLKLMLNSLYGKSAQRMGRGKFRCRVRAGLITSITRAALLRAVLAAKDPWSILELATDSVLSCEPLPLESPGLGGWERKKWPGGVFLLRPGLRFALDRKEDRTAARGVGTRSLHKARARVLRQWEKAPLESVTLRTPSFFHGAKLSVRRVMAPDVDFDERAFEYRRAAEYGRWTEETRTVKYGAAPKRASIAPDYRLHLWELPMGEDFVSCPYGMVGQSKLADDLDDMRDLEDDQPEPGLDSIL